MLDAWFSVRALELSRNSLTAVLFNQHKNISIFSRKTKSSMLLMHRRLRVILPVSFPIHERVNLIWECTSLCSTIFHLHIQRALFIIFLEIHKEVLNFLCSLVLSHLTSRNISALHFLKVGSGSEAFPPRAGNQTMLINSHWANPPEPPFHMSCQHPLYSPSFS